MKRADRVAVEDLDRIARLIKDLRRLYPVAMDVAEEVSLGGGIEGPGKRSVSYSDPTASTALDGRRQHRRSAVRRSRKAIANALRQIQEATFQALSAADG